MGLQIAYSFSEPGNACCCIKNGDPEVFYDASADRFVDGATGWKTLFRQRVYADKPENREELRNIMKINLKEKLRQAHLSYNAMARDLNLAEDRGIRVSEFRAILRKAWRGSGRYRLWTPGQVEGKFREEYLLFHCALRATGLGKRILIEGADAEDLFAIEQCMQCIRRGEIECLPSGEFSRRSSDRQEGMSVAVLPGVPALSPYP